MIGVITITFVLIQLLPGGPMAFLRAQIAQTQSGNQEMMNNVIETYISINPSKPLWQQYIDYVTSVLQGDLGKSLYSGESVAEILARTLPWTIFYASTSLVLTYSLAIPLGGLMAYYEGTKFDLTSTVVGMILNSIPYYIVGMLLLSVFGFKLGWFPTGGKIASNVEGMSIEFIISALHHSALMIFSFTITALGGVAISMRGNSISILGSDYLRVGRLRGLSNSRLATRYVSRNAMLPLYTQLLISMGYVFGGSTVLEVIYRYNAAGKVIFDALLRRDMPLLMGGFLVLTIAVVIGVLIADLTYGLLDPRASQGDADGF